MKPELNLRHLRAFCEVAERGSISAAADNIHLTQPAISQAMSKLERIVGIRLFLRTSTGMQLTEPGALFEQRIIKVLSQLDAGVRNAVAEERKRSGTSAPKFDHLLSVNHLRAMVCVAEASSFSGAARNLSISQPSLHRMARDLERLAGMAFFKSHGNGIDLTPPARAMVRFAKLALGEIEQAIFELNEWQGIDKTNITVGTLPLLRTAVLPNAINQFGRQFPNSVISVVDGPYDELLDGLRKGQLDFLVGALRGELSYDDIEQQSLFEDRLGIFGRIGHPLAGKRKLMPTTLARYPWVVPRRGAPTRTNFDNFFEHGDTPDRIVETSSLALVTGLLADSDRLTMISSHQISKEVQNGSVIRLDVKLADPPRDIGIAKRKDWRPTKIQSVFIEHIIKACP